MPPPVKSDSERKRLQQRLKNSEEEEEEMKKFVGEYCSGAKIRYVLKLDMNRNKLFDYRKSELVRIATQKAKHFNENIRNIESLTKDQLRFYILGGFRLPQRNQLQLSFKGDYAIIKIPIFRLEDLFKYIQKNKNLRKNEKNKKNKKK